MPVPKWASKPLVYFNKRCWADKGRSGVRHCNKLPSKFVQASYGSTSQDISFKHCHISDHIPAKLKMRFPFYSCIQKANVCQMLATHIKNKNIFSFHSKKSVQLKVFKHLTTIFLKIPHLRRDKTPSVNENVFLDL